MATGHRRFSGILMIVLIVLLAGAISTSLYFFKIKKNEEYQNQLHFRELREVGQSVDMAMSQLKSVSGNLQQKSLVVTIHKLLEITSKDNSATSITNGDAKIESTKDLIAQIKNQVATLPTSDLKFLFESKIELKKKLATAIEKEDAALDQLSTLERRMSGQIARIFETTLIEQDTDFERVVAYCSDLSSVQYCDHLNRVYSRMVDESWMDRLDFFDENIIFELEQEVQDEWQAIEAGLLEKLNADQGEQSKTKGAKQVKKSLSQSDLVKSQILILTKVGQIWRRLANILSGKNESEECAQNKQSHYDYTELNCITKEFLLIPEIERLIIAESTAINEVESLENQLEAIDREISYYVSQKTGVENNTDKNTLESILKNFGKISDFDYYDFYEEDANVNSENLPKIKNKAFEQLKKSLIDQLKNYKTASSLVNKSQFQTYDLVDKARENLLSLELMSSAAKEQTLLVLKNFKMNTVPRLVSIKQQERIRLANSSDALRRLYFKPDENNATVTNTNPLENNTTVPNAADLAEKTKDVFIISEKGEISRPIQGGQLIAPTVDFLPDSKLTLFPLIMLVDNNGNLLASKKSLQKSAAPADLGFLSVSSLLGSEDRKDGKVLSKMPLHSQMLEREIGGVIYRLFLQPVSSLHAIQSGTQLYLVGLVPKASLSLAKLSIFPTTAMWAMLALFVLTASIPLLKIRFVSTRKQFSTSDISQASFATLMLLGLLGIITSEHLFFSHFEDSKQQQAAAIYKQIVDDFNDEVTSIVQSRDGFDEGRDDCIHQLSEAHDRRGISMDVDYINITNCTNSQLALRGFSAEQSSSQANLSYEKKANYLLEGTFKLDSQGMFVASQIDDSSIDTLKLSRMRWLNPDLFISTDLLLDYRQYFKRAIECKVWGDDKFQSNMDKNCARGWFFERINNVRDARKTTQFSFPMFNLQNTPLEQRNILSLSTRMRTFFHRVLPKDFGYAVFDDNGKVIFHSDDQRSLLENMLVETDNNGQILSLLNHADAAADPVEFRSIYRNSEHQFVGGRLHGDVPLSLVIFYKRHPVAINNLLLIMLAIGIYFGIVLPLFLACRFATNQITWGKLLSYNANQQKNYQWYAWMLFGGWAFTQLSMGVVQDLGLRICLWLMISGSLLCFLLFRLSPSSNKNRTLYPLFPFLIALIVFSAFVFANWSNVVLNWDVDIPLFVLGFGIVLFVCICTLTWNKTRHQTSNSNQIQPRISRGHACYLSMLIWLLAMAPASLIVNSVNGYLLDYQAHVQSEHLQLQNQLYHAELTDYLRLMRTKEQGIHYQRTDWFSEKSLENLLLFTANQEGSSKNWISVKDSDEHKADPLLNTFAGMGSLGNILDAELHFLAKTDERDSESIFLSYDANKYMLAAISSQWLLIFITLFSLLVFTYYFVMHLIVQRLFGEHIPENFRKQDFAVDKHRIAQARELIAKSDPFYCQILRASDSRIKALISAILRRKLWRNNVIPIDQCLDQGNDVNPASFTLLQQFTEQFSGDNSPSVVLVLSGLDKLAFSKKQRLLALQLIQQLVHTNKISIVLACEVAPLYRLCKPHAYPGIDKDQVASAEECLAWAELLATFDKIYDWSPQAKQRLEEGAGADETLAHESQGWQELSAIAEEFSNYHRNVRAPGEQCNIESINKHWSSAQIVEYFTSHAGPLYRFKWQHCTADERTLLYQIANGALVNPANTEVLEHLVKRGYLYRDVGWFLTNASFKRFILSAETEEFFKESMEEANSGVWQYVRIPLMVGVLVLVAFIVFTTGQSIETVLTMFTAVLGLIPLLLRNINMFRGDGG